MERRSRPALDALWLERLERDGPAALGAADSPDIAAALTPSLALLRARRYYDAHESLEALWLPAPYPRKLFYYALIKLAVGLLHLERRHARSAASQLSAGAQCLAPFTPTYGGLDTATLHAQAQSLRDALTADGDTDALESALARSQAFTWPSAPAG